MVGCTLAAGMPVTVHDPDPAAMASVPGASAAPSPRAVAEASDVIGLAVMDEAQVREACTGADGIFAGAAPGTVVLVHSTIAHDVLREVATAGAARDVRVLDAPVTGERGHHSVPDLCVMVGGDAEAFAAARPLLDTFAGLVVHLGPLGAGLDAKLALNVLRYLGFLVSQEGARLAGTAGVDDDVFARLVEHAGAFRFTGDFGSDRDAEDLPRRRLNVSTADKDLRAALARSGELGGDLPVTGRSLDLLHRIWGTPAPTDS
jgi:3-hydroxyisobutyrate dehydrogenase